MLSSALQYSARILENPVAAATLGILFAAALLVASRLSMRALTPDSGPVGLAIASVSLFARLAAATGAIWAYKRYFEPGFKPFALSLAGGFVVLYTLEVVRYSGTLKKRSRVGASK